MSGEGKGEFQKRIDEILQVECNICHLDFSTIERFQDHWRDAHEATYGKGYPKITQYSFIKDACQKVLDEFRREIPYRHTEGHTYIDPVKLPEVVKKWLGEEQK